MLRSFQERRDSEEGFTLIELMVVVLIIGILLAIAVPTFLNAQNNAKTKAATSNLRTSLSSVKTVYSDKQSYATAATATTASPIDAAVMKAAEPSLTWTFNAGVTSPEAISFVGTADAMGLATRSALGECFFVIDSVNTTSGGTQYAKQGGNNASCAASATAFPTTSTDNPVTTGSSPKAAGW